MKRLILDLDEEKETLDLLDLVDNCFDEGIVIELSSSKMDFLDLLQKSTGDYWLRELIGMSETFNGENIRAKLNQYSL